MPFYNPVNALRQAWNKWSGFENRPTSETEQQTIEVNGDVAQESTDSPSIPESPSQAELPLRKRRRSSAASLRQTKTPKQTITAPRSASTSKKNVAKGKAASRVKKINGINGSDTAYVSPPSTPVGAEPPKKRRGRPPGTGKKQKLLAEAEAANGVTLHSPIVSVESSIPNMEESATPDLVLTTEGIDTIAGAEASPTESDEDIDPERLDFERSLKVGQYVFVHLEDVESQGYNQEEGIYPIARITYIWREPGQREVRVAWLYPREVLPDKALRQTIQWGEHERVESDHHQNLHMDNLLGHARVCSNCTGCDVCLEEGIPHWYQRVTFPKDKNKPAKLVPKKVYY